MRTRKDIEVLEKEILAPYAMRSEYSAGRCFSEPSHEIRTCYQRDRDRIVHSEAFRKLEYKTQVFAVFEGDYYRTRLTHTIEVAQIARTIARSLCLNEDLVEAIALAHDLGHPPFGHAGEAALDEIMKAAGLLGFNHNLHSFEIVTKIEKRYPDFDGLNLTQEVLIGILRHKTVYDFPGAATVDMEKGVTLESEVVDVADSLAYLAHDIDDGITSGCLNEKDLMESSLWNKAYTEVTPLNILAKDMLKYQIVKVLIDKQIKDLLAYSSAKIKGMNLQSYKDVPKSKEAHIGFSPTMAQEREFLQELINKKFYHHYRVERMTSKARRIIYDLFEVYKNNPQQLPYSIYQRDRRFTKDEEYQIICNYIASMTDRFALDEHKKFFDPYQKV